MTDQPKLMDIAADLKRYFGCHPEATKEDILQAAKQISSSHPLVLSLTKLLIEAVNTRSETADDPTNLLATNASQAERIYKLVEALEFYADRDIYRHNYEQGSEASDDQGETARKALAEHRGDK